MTDIEGGRFVIAKDVPGFTPGTNRGVLLRPLLSRDAGDPMSLCLGRIEVGAEIAWEEHPPTETVYVLAGELECSIGEGPVTRVGPGQLWHVRPGLRHLVRNRGDRAAEFIIAFA
jgi:quercetin dioxygenase-like cupin family protein